MRKNKMIIVALTFGIIFGGTGGWIVGQSNSFKMPVTQIFDSPNAPSQAEVINRVLADTKLQGNFNASEVQDYRVYSSDITGDGTKDYVVLISFDPKNSIVAAYTPTGDTYQYLGEAGRFYQIDDISFIPIPEQNRDMIVIKESITQDLGSFESIALLKGFLYEDGFQSVLNLPLEIDAKWNLAWNPRSTLNGENEWQRITAIADYNWNEDGTTTLDLTNRQTFLSTGPTDMQQVPQDSSFKPIEERIVEQEYYWSDKWNNFIVDEATIKGTGEVVGVTQILSQSPYSLAGFQGDDVEIVHSDGEREYVLEDSVVLSNAM